jgi:glycosyltransferase involved in cell wall biosynthesis
MRVSAHVAFLSVCSQRWGGSEELWSRAACALRDGGHTVDVMKGNVDRDHPRIRELTRRGCAVTDLNELVPRRLALALSAVAPGRAGLDALRHQALVAAARLMVRRPQLAIISQGGNFNGTHLALVCARLRVPFVLVAQSASEVSWPSDRMRPALVEVLARSRRSLFVSAHNLRVTEHQIGRPVPRAEVVRNPVPAGRELPLPWPAASGDALRLACVGRLLIAEKGQDILLEALAEPRRRERPVHVSFFGEGPNRDGLREMAGWLGVERVSFPGQVASFEDVWRTHHALALSSRIEGQSLALLEAMACGRVPIVTDVGGNGELIEDGRTGFVAEAPTAAAFGAALDRAWECRQRWPEIGAAAARRVEDPSRASGSARLAEVALEEAGRR